MSYIAKDTKLFNLLSSDISILSSAILGIKMHLVNFSLVIEVDFKLLYGDEKYLKIVFSRIKEYAFNYQSDRVFYNVEVYKLLKKGTLFYISFDPCDSDLSEISEKDNDMILCESIEGCFNS
ncbi:hypothetical protein ACFOET_06680 [Parapedobacter deserti]|uniref:Uncharacterized protein n=1 Tax=Parapedobacter deserti TaxID=1912957 RepID=A0ABV7JPP8_9SPHI